MIPEWPVDLPRPRRDGWQAAPQESRLRRRSDSGPPGYRRRFSSVARLVTLAIDVSRDGKAIFDNFYAEDTADGSLPFYMPDPTTDGWALLTDEGVPILTGDGEQILLAETWLCQFGDALPSETIRGVEFRITFSVVVLP